MTSLYKLAVHVPLSHADAVRTAMGDAGAGRIGHYSHCSFSVRGTGRYKAGDKASPHIGRAGEFSQAEEERIEVTVAAAVLPAVIAAIRAAHPYEEPTFDIYPLTSPDDLPGR